MKLFYFSRSPIPSSLDESIQRFQHIGVYAYTPETLRECCNLSPTPLEKAESLEQLRWIESRGILGPLQRHP